MNLHPHRSARTASASQALMGHYLCMRLRAAYLTVHRHANANFSRFKLTADQFVLLTVLTESSGITQKELARRASSDPNTISAMVARLERRGLVGRERHAEDGRALKVSLTKKGWEAHRRATEGVAPFNELVANLIATDELESLLGNLNHIVEDLSENSLDENNGVDEVAA